MPLDADARLYAEALFIEQATQIRQQFAGRPADITRKAAARGAAGSGGHFAELARVGLEETEALANARADSSLAAYAKARIAIDHVAVDEIFEQVKQVCDVRRDSLLEQIRLATQRIGADSVRGAMAAEITREASQIAAKVRHKLVVKAAEAKLEARPSGAVTPPEDLDDLLPLLAKRIFDQDFVGLKPEASATAPLSLLLVDLDHFKSVNDSFGHAAGDEVLVEAARTLKAICVNKGRCYRWGGEELVVLLPNYTASEAGVLAERIRGAIAGLKFKNYPEAITASIGVASYPEACEAVEDLFKIADEAMYVAKNKGRNRVVVAPAERGTMPAGLPSSPRLSSSEISKKLDAVQVTASVESGRAQWFLCQLRNDSGEEVLIKEVRLESRDGIRLTEPGRPQTRSAWKIGPQGTLPVGWRAQTDPAASLVRMNSNSGALFEIELRVILLCEILETQKECISRLWVQVDASGLRITQLAG